MRGATLVREALRRVSVLLNDADTQFNRYTEQSCVDLLNDAALVAVTFVPTLGVRVDSIRLQPGSKQDIELIAADRVIPGDGAAAAEVRGINLMKGPLRNMGQNGASPGRAVRVVDGKTLDAVDPYWHSPAKASAVVRSIVFDPLMPRHFWTEPAVHATTAVWLEIPYSAQPDRIPDPSVSVSYLASGTNTTRIPLPDDCLQWLVDYVVARSLYEANEWADAQRGSKFADMAIGWLNSKVQAITGVNPNLKRLPMARAPIAEAS
jgi:hypothetical protein